MIRKFRFWCRSDVLCKCYCEPFVCFDMKSCKEHFTRRALKKDKYGMLSPRIRIAFEV